MIQKLICLSLLGCGLMIANNVSATIVSAEKLRDLRDFLSNVPQIGQFNRIIRENSSAVVLIYSISSKVQGSDTETGKDVFFNIAIKPRTSEYDYRYGVISGVVISNDGVVVTTHDCVQYADTFIVSIDSEQRIERPVGVMLMTKNDFKAKLIKDIPELNLAFLQIERPETQASRKFQYLNIANDAAITDGNDKRYLLNGGVVYGKCRAEEMFVSERNPSVNTNSFKDYRFFCSRISSDIFEGSRRLVIYNPVVADVVTPEVHGGALITLDATLLGLAIYQKDLNAPMSYAIPSSMIKKGMQLATPWLIKLSEDSSLGFEVEPLNSTQKKQLIKIINNWDSSLYSDIATTFTHTIDGNQFGKLQDEVENGHCGVVVSSIVENGISANSGLKQGDVILTVRGVGVTSTKCFHNLEAQAIGEQYVELRVVPLGQKFKANNPILYIPIYKDANNSSKSSNKIKPIDKTDSSITILDRIKRWINQMKYEKNLKEEIQ